MPSRLTPLLPPPSHPHQDDLKRTRFGSMPGSSFGSDYRARKRPHLPGALKTGPGLFGGIPAGGCTKHGRVHVLGKLGSGPCGRACAACLLGCLARPELCLAACIRPCISPPTLYLPSTPSLPPFRSLPHHGLCGATPRLPQQRRQPTLRPLPRRPAAAKPVWRRQHRAACLWRTGAWWSSPRPGKRPRPIVRAA